MLLAINTSGPYCSAALYDVTADKPVGEKSEDLGRGHAERLMPMLEELLADARLDWSDITRLAVVNGPGSFTGLRVGLATARGLALALNVPCNGVTVFEAFGEACGTQEPLGVVIDAKRDQIWMQCFAEGTALGEPLAVENGSAAQKIPRYVTRLVGSAASSLAGELGPAMNVLSTSPSPPIEAVARHAAHQAPAAGKPKPLYLRAPDAKPQSSTVRSA